MRRISSHGACLLDPAELTRTRGGAQVRAAHHVVGAVGAGLPAGLKKKELMRTVRSLLKQLSESEREEICLFFGSLQFQIRMNSLLFSLEFPASQSMGSRRGRKRRQATEPQRTKDRKVFPSLLTEVPQHPHQLCREQ